MPIQRSRSADPLSRAEFEALLRAWYDDTDEQTIGGDVRYGGTRWVWVQYGADRFHLNADTTRTGVEEYLATTEMHPDVAWTIVEGRTGRRTKVLFGPDRKAIPGFYLYARDNGLRSSKAMPLRGGSKPPAEVRRGGSAVPQTDQTALTRTMAATDQLDSGGSRAPVTDTHPYLAPDPNAEATSHAPKMGFASLLIGQVLGDRYRIEALIGRGGMGAVYRAVDERLERKVALKVIAIEPANPEVMERMRGRFRREARAAARLRHPNVVAIHDYGTEGRFGLDYLVMELLVGDDLATRLARTPVFPLRQAVCVLAEASQGIAAGHRAGLVHRDVKPANLFLERADVPDDERVRVLDFGIAQVVDAADDTLTHLTVFGSGPISPAYASPEQLRGERELTPAADVFSLAVTGFQMLVGARPFSPAEIQDIAVGRSLLVPSAREYNPEIPEGLDEVLRKGMALSPGDRFTDAAAFASALLRSVDCDGRIGSRAAPVGEAPLRTAAPRHQRNPRMESNPLPAGNHPWLAQLPEPVGEARRHASSADIADRHRLKHVPTASELEGRVLCVTPEVLQSGNPRRPFTHGWLAFEVLLRHGGGRMPFDEYRKRLFNPGPEIRALAQRVPGVPDAYQDLKHIRHDIRFGRVVVE